MYEIDIVNSQQALPVDETELAAALETALRAEGVGSAVLSVSIVDNAAIHVINRDHLQHDYPTDVISFQLDFYPDKEDGSQGGRRGFGASIEGEIVASAEMAVEMAADAGWEPITELKLYLIHGMLHICGYDDLTPDEQCLMRDRERAIMGELGYTPVYAEDRPDDCPATISPMNSGNMTANDSVEPEEPPSSNLGSGSSSVRSRRTIG